MEQEQQSQVDAESNWEDIEKLVEEKWAMVRREIRATVLKKDIQRVLRHKKRIPKSGQDIERNFQVMQFMNWQLKYPDLPWKTVALNTAAGWRRGTLIAVREYLEGAGENISRQGLAKAVTEY
ncbi:hypothetical protein L873DRAFT_1790506 [Choiromyces venosus 120613-1]|uniref:Uncharacterized protein n=1 Tax=Choiromyces venosus 120613-1 TaxID=1336337 RepID=A0A3N4JWT4_9PEZI|nr:hypothetical protein L873DRAFT_1790506 [Choiromyces venosus 120613-1]